MKPTSAPTNCPQMEQIVNEFIQRIQDSFDAIVPALESSLADVQNKFLQEAITSTDARQQASDLKDKYLAEIDPLSDKFATQMLVHLALPTIPTSDVLTGSGIPAKLWPCIKDKVSDWNRQVKTAQDSINAAYNNVVTTFFDSPLVVSD